MDFAGIPRPAFGRAGQHVEATAPPSLRGKAVARHHLAAKKAASLCPTLPAAGEHVHCLMTGFYDLAQVVVDVARRTLPRALRIATLCLNKRNVVDLAGLMESRAGDPLPLTLLASGFFKRHNKELVEWAREQFAPFSARLAFAESHCKVVCFDLGPGDALVFEGSANLRTNRNREQLTIIRDRATHDWHAGWIDGLVGDGEA
jgi:hypothetical protein